MLPDGSVGLFQPCCSGTSWPSDDLFQDQEARRSQNLRRTPHDHGPCETKIVHLASSPLLFGGKPRRTVESVQEHPSKTGASEDCPQHQYGQQQVQIHLSLCSMRQVAAAKKSGIAEAKLRRLSRHWRDSSLSKQNIEPCLRIFRPTRGKWGMMSRLLATTSRVSNHWGLKPTNGRK